VELIYSNRSAMSYDDLREYLERIRHSNEAQDSLVDWKIVDPSLLRAVNHDQLAGLQLADALASGVYFAVNKNQYGEIEDRYLRLLAPTLYRHEKKLEGFGLKFWCADSLAIERIIQTVNEKS
jgi:hypothetical protein